MRRGKFKNAVKTTVETRFHPAAVSSKGRLTRTATAIVGGCFEYTNRENQPHPPLKLLRYEGAFSEFSDGLPKISV